VARTARLADLRRRGVRGGIIAPHRAMAGLRVPRARVLASALLGVGGTVAVFLALNPLAEWWARLYEALAGPLGLDGGVGIRTTSVLGLQTLQTPFFLAEAAQPGPAEWLRVAIITGVVLLATFLLPQRWTPLRYFLRFAGLLQVITLAWFALAPAGSFPHTVSSYTGGLLGAGQVVLVLLPLVLTFTWYLFDIAWARKLLLAGMLLGHLAVFIPLQVMVHAWLLVRGSLLLLPPLFLLFGILAQVLVFVAFYGWGMSWPAARRQE
jgi:hypothetical protein